jgi:hypothetical protein
MELLFKKNLEYYNDIETQKKYDLYLRMFYNEKDMCPIDNKLELIRKKEGNKIDLSCEKKNWGVSITLPKAIHFDNELENKKKTRDNILYKLRFQVSDIGFEGILSNDMDKEINKLTAEFNKVNKEIEDMEKIYILQKKEIETYMIQNMEYINKLSLLKIKRMKIYKMINSDVMNEIVKDDLMAIYLNEGDLNPTRISQIASQKKLNLDNVKNYFEWCNITKEYVDLNIKLVKNKEKIAEINKLFNIMNNNFYLELPMMVEKGDEMKVKKIKIKKTVKK